MECTPAEGLDLPVARDGSRLRAILATPDEPVAVVRAGSGWLVASEPREVLEGDGHSLDALDRATPGLWAGFIAFEAGHAIETVRPGAASAAPRSVPDVLLVRFGHVERLANLDDLDWPGVRLGAAARSTLTRGEYLDAVERILDHIRAGDCYQVNLTRTLEWDLAADPVALFGALAHRRPAPHAALLRLARRDGETVAVAGASPERFVAWAGPAVETRPIKGTAAHPAALAASEKDRAENVMIVDLARNDLGRVCIPGSIHVPALCTIERHPGLAHLVSTVRGHRRPDVGVGPLLRATLPPASVTGAPKPRVLQIIEDVERAPRGVYCGALGWIDTARDVGDLAVAIRTFTVAGGRTTLGIGGGIVADSQPECEWDETCLKARRIFARTGATDAALVGAHR